MGGVTLSGSISCDLQTRAAIRGWSGELGAGLWCFGGGVRLWFVGVRSTCSCSLATGIYSNDGVSEATRRCRFQNFL